MSAAISDDLRESLARLVKDCTGLHFSPERWPDLERGIQQAARELGFCDMSEAISHLLDRPVSDETIKVLAKHLTVGETYFFRDPKLLEALETTILPPLINFRRQSGRRYLNIWSAACCTGEEPFSIAILLSRMLPDLAEWQIKICATDINREFLAKAEAGVFSQWSFRGSSEDLTAKHFTTTADQHFVILPKYRKMVHFSFLNLINETGPSGNTNEDHFDVIFCRNVLMYFSPEQCARTVAKLSAKLAYGGWLMTSAAEAGPAFAPLEPVSFSGAMAYRKPWPGANPVPKDVGFSLPVSLVEPSPGVMLLPPSVVTEKLAEKKVTIGIEEVKTLQKKALQKADLGQFEEALQHCDEALALDKMSAALHYLRGSILQEQGQLEIAITSLRRALYLDHEYAPAYFALGTVMRQSGRKSEETKYFETAWQLLQKIPPENILSEFSGMTAGRLTEMIRSIR